MHAQRKGEPAEDGDTPYQRYLKRRAVGTDYITGFAIDEAHPFHCPATCAIDIVLQIRALSQALAGAYHDADRINRAPEAIADDERALTGGAYPVHTARVFEAFDTLASFALLLDEVREP